MLSTFVTLYFSESYGKAFFYQEIYLDSQESLVPVEVSELKQGRMFVEHSSTKGFVYNLTSDTYRNVKHDFNINNWTFNSGSINSVQFPYDDHAFFIFKPEFFRNRDKNFNKYSITSVGNITIDLNHFNYQCLVDGVSTVSCNSDKKTIILPHLNFTDPVDMLLRANDSMLAQTDFGKMGFISLKHLSYNYTAKASTKKWGKIFPNQFVNSTTNVKMIFLDELYLTESQNRTLKEGNVTYRIQHTSAKPRWHRAINPNYIEWALITVVLFVNRRNRTPLQLLSTGVELTKYCFPLLIVNKYVPEIGKYFLCILPEILLFSYGVRQYDRGFIMRFRSDVIKENFVDGDCVTYTVLSCIENNIDTVSVKRVGDSFHIRPIGPVKLKNFLSLYFSGFYLSNRKMTLEDRILRIFTRSTFSRNELYTSLMWSLFERQGYVKDFFVFEAIVASYHPKFSTFKANLMERSIKETPDTCKRVVYYVFANTKVSLPNWGDYKPSIVNFTFVKPQKTIEIPETKQEIVHGHVGLVTTIASPDGIPSLTYRSEKSVKSKVVVRRSCQYKHRVKAFNGDDFKHHPFQKGTTLTYNKPAEVIRVLRMCSSCLEFYLKFDHYQDLKQKPKVTILKGHSKQCEKTIGKLKSLNKTGLRPLVDLEHNFHTSPLDKIFMKTNFTRKSIGKKISKIPLSKFQNKERSVVKKDKEVFKVDVTLQEPEHWASKYESKIKMSELLQLAKDDSISDIYIAHLKGDIKLKNHSSEKARIQSLRRFIQNYKSLECIIEFDIPHTSVTELNV